MRNNYIKNIEILLMKSQRLVKYLILSLAIFSFTTGNSQCNYTVACSDSWGDGWNGSSSLSITVDGVEKGPVTGTQVTGSSYTKTLTDVPYDATIVMTLSGTSGADDYVREITAVLKDPDGTSVATVNDGTRSTTTSHAGTDASWNCTQDGIVAGSLSGSSFTSCSGSAGGERSFSVQGGSLTGNLTVMPPSGYEVSLTSGSGFNSSSITLTQSGGSLNTTVYARLTSAASNGASGNNCYLRWRRYYCKCCHRFWSS